MRGNLIDDAPRHAAKSESPTCHRHRAAHNQQPHIISSQCHRAQCSFGRVVIVAPIALRPVALRELGSEKLPHRLGFRGDTPERA
jgi:hypothetical protein